MSPDPRTDADIIPFLARIPPSPSSSSLLPTYSGSLEPPPSTPLPHDQSNQHSSYPSSSCSSISSLSDPYTYPSEDDLDIPYPYSPGHGRPTTSASSRTILHARKASASSGRLLQLGSVIDLGRTKGDGVDVTAVGTERDTGRVAIDIGVYPDMSISARGKQGAGFIGAAGGPRKDQVVDKEKGLPESPKSYLATPESSSRESVLAPVSNRVGSLSRAELPPRGHLTQSSCSAAAAIAPAPPTSLDGQPPPLISTDNAKPNIDDGDAARPSLPIRPFVSRDYHRQSAQTDKSFASPTCTSLSPASLAGSSRNHRKQLSVASSGWRSSGSVSLAATRENCHSRGSESGVAGHDSTSSPSIRDHQKHYHDDTGSANNVSPSENDTFGTHLPLRQTEEKGPSRLSVYDPLGGGLSDIASYGSTSTRSKDNTELSSSLTDRHFCAHVKSMKSTRSTRSPKSTKSARSGKSGKTAKSRSGSKRTSTTSLAYKFAHLDWTLRSVSPYGDRSIGVGEEEDGQGLLGTARSLDHGLPAIPGGARGGSRVAENRQEARKKSMRTVKREENELDLGKLLGRAAVLEKILSAGKRVSNQSLRYHPIRATASPLTVPPLPSAPLPKSQRVRPSSLTSAKTAESSSSFSGSIPPLPPLPRSSHSTRRSDTSELGMGRIRAVFIKRVRREGDYGGEGYTSLPGSAVGSRADIPRDVWSGSGVEEKNKADDVEKEKKGGLEVFTPEPGYESRYKEDYRDWNQSDYNRWCRPRRLSISATHIERDKEKTLQQDNRDLEKDTGCFDGYTASAIVRPPSCIPLSDKYTKDIPPGVLNLNRPLPLLPPTSAPRPPNSKDIPANNQIRSSGIYLDRHSRVLSFISTGEVSQRSRRRWVIWVGVGCVVGLGIVSAVLAGVLAGK